MYDDFKKHGHGYALQLIINNVEGDYSQLSKKLAKVDRARDKGLKGIPEPETGMLRQEAIELAVKLDDKELAKHLERAPFKAIQRRINALREEVAYLRQPSLFLEILLFQSAIITCVKTKLNKIMNFSIFAPLIVLFVVQSSII